MKYLFSSLIILFLLSCSKVEEPIENGSIVVNFSVDLRGNTIGVFDPSTVDNSFIDNRKALKTQSILSNREELNDLLAGNYIVIVLESTAYLRAAQVQKNKKSEIFF